MLANTQEHKEEQDAMEILEPKDSGLIKTRKHALAVIREFQKITVKKLLQDIGDMEKEDLIAMAKTVLQDRPEDWKLTERDLLKFMKEYDIEKYETREKTPQERVEKRDAATYAQILKRRKAESRFFFLKRKQKRKEKKFYQKESKI